MKIRIILILLIFPFLTFAQIETKTDSSNILIGDQIILSIKSNIKDIKNWKEFQDSIANFEIISKSKIDSSKTENGWIISQEYVLTIWDSGTFFIPSIEIENKSSDSIKVYVNNVKTNQDQEIKDIKKPINTPVTFEEAFPYILIFIALALICLLIYYFFKNKEKVIEVKKVEKIIVPPYQIALDLLNTLKDKELLQQNEINEYHTQISEITRRYIEAGLNIQAMEIASNDILNLLEQQRIETKSIKKVFEINDLAKFAKYKPIEIENKECLEMAILFVEQTKPKQNELQ
jgi:DNA-binding ferritin-like protein (Dps family)